MGWRRRWVGSRHARRMSDEAEPGAAEGVGGGMSEGKVLEQRQPLRINKPRYWTMDGSKIAAASPDACRKAGWIESVAEPQPLIRWGVTYTLTNLGRAALERAQENPG